MECSYEAAKIEDIPPIVIDLFDMEVKTIGSNDTTFLSRHILHVNPDLFEDVPSKDDDGNPVLDKDGK